MKTLTELADDLKYYEEIRKRNQKERRFRMAEGAQQNIDRVIDEMRKLKGKDNKWKQLLHQKKQVGY